MKNTEQKKEYLEVTVLVPKDEVFITQPSILHEWNPDFGKFELIIDETIHIDVPCLGDFEIQDWDEMQVEKWALENHLEEKGQ